MKERTPMTPQFFDDSGASIYEYDYCFDNFDKIYYTRGDEELKEDMLKHTSTIKVNHVLAGDIKREFEIEDKQLIIRLQEMVTKHLSHYIGQNITEVNLKNPQIETLPWINYMRPGEFNPLHNHSGVFSFVWYLDIPEEIREEWKDPKVETNLARRGLIEFHSQVLPKHVMTFNPQTNDFFMFNAGHMHQVYPYYSDNTRISLAGNIYDYK